MNQVNLYPLPQSSSWPLFPMSSLLFQVLYKHIVNQPDLKLSYERFGAKADKQKKKVTITSLIAETDWKMPVFALPVTSFVASIFH